MKLLERLEVLFERTLWGSRLIILVAVLSSMLMAVGMVYMATVDVGTFLGYLGAYADLTRSAELRKDLRAQTVTVLIKAVDGYLIASMLLIFAFGLYQLFISKLEVGEAATAVPPLPRLQGIGELKDRLIHLILLVLVIEFFQYALRLSYTEPRDLLYLAGGILAVGGALYLSALKGPTAH